MTEAVYMKELHPVFARFPESKPEIQKLYNENVDFRELCEDYIECLAVLDRLLESQDAGGSRIEQYCELRVNLEHDIIERISHPANR